ncbi:unnamed protein product [Bubo scandiacus]
MAPLSLSQLLDVAIGTPQAGAVNFTALYSLLQAMLGHLGLQDLPAPGRGHSPTPLLGRDQPPEAPPREEGGQGGGPGTESLTPAKDPLQGAVSTPQDASVAADVGQMKTKIEENESSISKAVALSQDLLEEIGGMKAAQSRMEEDIRMIQETLGMGNLQDAAGQLPALRDQTALDSDVKKLKERLSLYPAPEEDGSEGQAAPAEPPTADMDTPHGASSALGLKGPRTQPAPRTSKGTSEGTAQTQPGSQGTQRAPVAPEKGAGASSDKTKTSDARSSDTQSTTPGVQPGTPSTQSTTPRVQPGAPSTQTTTPRVQPGSPDKESISSVLADLQGRVSSLQGLTSDLQGKNGKIRQLEDALGKLEVAGANWRGDVSDQITLQLGSTLQEVKRKLKELEEQQEMTKATLERLVAKTADELQEQLGEPRAMVASTGQEQAEVQAACPVCSTDISKQVGQLLQRYEKLQELVDDCMSRQAAGKVVRQLPGRSQQDEELLKRIQAAVTQVQGDYEQLNSVTGNLLHDRHQKEKDIEALFRSLERLEKEKANKEDLVLGIDVKADKTALAGKVSRTQFDASMERLNEMIQETLSRVTGQEQGWHQVQRQLSEEMDSKLDRLELGPFRQQLEEHWRSTLEQLKEKEPLTEADDAAGTKKQLLAHFHCMSCDRPLSVLVPGPHIVAIPYMPPLPPHLDGRSHTVLEMEQTPQHSHRERVAECGYPSVPRRCGGRHTLTHPLQRGPRRQPHPPGAPRPLQPPTLLPIKHDETELLGQDGHIYRGRRGVQLPVLVGKEDFPRAKPKLSPRQWDARDTSRLLSRPQSAASSLSQPGIPTSPEHRPASSHRRRLCQARGLLLPPQPSWDGSSTSEASQDWGSPTEPPPPRPPSRRASVSDQQQ